MSSSQPLTTVPPGRLFAEHGCSLNGVLVDPGGHIWVQTEVTGLTQPLNHRLHLQPGCFFFSFKFPEHKHCDCSLYFKKFLFF